MNSNIQKTIDEHMKTLPHDVGEAIRQSSWERKILVIGRKYGLHVDQLEILQTELSLAVLGLSGRDEFVRETMHEARIDKQMMNLIVADINKEIFEPIRNHLHKTRQEETQEEVRHSGLEKNEEETLRRHGVSFDFDEEETKQTTLLVSQKVEEQEKPKEQIQKILETPLVISQEKPKKTNSFEDLLSIGPNVVSVSQTEEVVGEVVNEEENQATQSPFDIEMNSQESKTAKTQEHQKMIDDSKKPIYVSSDPYREPIE